MDRFIPGQPEVDTLRDITEQELRTKTYGQAAPEPLLGHYFELPRRPDRQDRIELDDSLPTVRPLVFHKRPLRSVTRVPSVFADSPVLPPAHGVDGAGAAAAYARADPRDAAQAEHPSGQEDARRPLQAALRHLDHRASRQHRAQARAQVRPARCLLVLQLSILIDINFVAVNFAFSVVEIRKLLGISVYCNQNVTRPLQVARNIPVIVSCTVAGSFPKRSKTLDG